MLLFVVALMLSSCSAPIDRYTTALCQSARQGIMFGHHDDTLYGLGNGLNTSDTYLVCGQYPALLSLELYGIEAPGSLYWGTIPFDSLRSAVVAQHERGGHTTISWHARNPSTGRGYDDLSVPDVVRRILTKSTPEHRTFLKYLDRLATFFTSLRDSRGRLIPVIFRPWHENHGSWFWWGQAYCTSDDYVKLYRFTASELKRRGAKNLIYAYSPGSVFRDTADYLSRYPGDDVVNIIGFEAYMSERASSMTVEQTRQEFISRVQRNFSIVDSIAIARRKLTAITESGIKPNYDAEWWTKALLPAIEGHTPCYINVWSNHWQGAVPAWSTYPGEKSAEDFKIFTRHHKVRMIDK